MSVITVIGSISTDFVVTSDVRPEIGETVEGINFERSFGGKGANQAVAAARLGGQVQIVGAVGVDSFGDDLLNNLMENNISTENVERVTHSPSGTAVITLQENDNAIIYVAGANNQMTQVNSEELVNVINHSDLVVLQNEIPQAQNELILEMCQSLGKPVLYNPAPARSIDKNRLDQVTYFTPNESEFKLIFPDLSLSEGVKLYPNKLFITLGSKGVLYHDGHQEVMVPAYKVNPTDTTGAGDTFNGAFSVAITNGLSIEESVRFGNLASSISIQKFGAQGGMPSLTDMKGSQDYEETWHIE